MSSAVAATASAESVPQAAPAPTVFRRMAAFLYEGVLLFGILMLAGLLYGVLTQQRHALIGSTGLQAFLFGVLGLYFVYFWSRSGQTLAMLTWHVRLVTTQGHRVRPMRAVARYLLSWLWFLPALLILESAGLRGFGPTTAVMVSGVLAYAAIARLHPDRQFLHDALCGTRLITWHPVRRRQDTPAA